MIVAIYVEAITLLQPVTPVTRTKRITPQKRDSHSRSRQDACSFAAMLEAMSKVEPEDASNGFDAIA
ncbi:MAG: hypothetical protein J5986_06680 [Roseburia sp.]|nr:hypothetical protein [Roseburia sp.]